MVHREDKEETMSKYILVIDEKDSDITTVDLSKVLRDNFFVNIDR